MSTIAIDDASVFRLPMSAIMADATSIFAESMWAWVADDTIKASSWFMWAVRHACKSVERSTFVWFKHHRL